MKMTVRLRRPAIVSLVALGLLLASLATLYVGRFIQFDDVSGFGHHEWVMTLGLLAGLIAISSVAVACQESTARRVFGAALLLLAVGMFVVAQTDDGFRFIWTTYEGELTLFTIGVGMVALLLLTPSFSATPAGLSGYLRGVSYLAATMLFAFVAFWAGVSYYDRTECAGDFDGECDLGILEGFVWAAVALVVALSVIVTWEIVRRRRRPRI